RVRTETDLPTVPLSGQDPAGGAERVAYVVLDTGEKDTVALQRGSSERLTTWSADEATKAGAAGNAAVALLVKWVKINNVSVDQYTYGEGELKSLVFESTDQATDGSLLNFSGSENVLHARTVVTVDDFVGTYLAFSVEGGGMKLSLDGYARNITKGPEVSVLPPGTNSPPTARFFFAPNAPSSSDYVTFTDASSDTDGVIVFHQWTFGDGGSSILASPKHRFQAAGVYNVTLNVTDNLLGTGEVTHQVTVSNTPPVSDWDFDPKAPHALDDVHFTNKSWDPDGRVVLGVWDFGDGTHAPAGPGTVVHVYLHAGNYTATLTVTDNNGATNALSKVITVLDSPPTCAFSYVPSAPLSLTTVNFTDGSHDPDGTLVAWSWTFGDGGTSADQSPTHVYAASGLFTVGLTVVDDSHSTTTCSTSVTVGNRPPIADFSYAPLNITTNTEVRFTDHSTDPDGTVTSWSWNFGDGSAPSSLQNPRHRFTSSGVYTTCMTPTDNSGASGLPKCTPIAVVNSPPVADFSWSPDSAHAPVTNQSVAFTDKTTDPDATDTLVNWTWTFGDGGISFDKNPTHRFVVKGTYQVHEIVKDNHGNPGAITHAVTIYDSLPSAAFSFTPSKPTTKDNVTFNATVSDTDGTVVNESWNFGDASPLKFGLSVVHRFTSPGTYTVALTATDNDGGQTTTSKSVTVDKASATAAFTWSPTVPQPAEAVAFTDQSSPGDSPITKWDWDFGDGSSHGSDQNPTHTYSQPGHYTVTLTVTDSASKTAKASKSLRVNTKPTASFSMNRSAASLNSPISLTDTSNDPDGHIVAWLWDFGDGQTATTQNATHSWSTGGVFTVKLNVTDNDGGKGATSKTVSISDQPPHAEFSATPSPGTRNSPVQFNDLSTDPDGPVTAWTWDFGDSSGTSPLENPMHAYTRSGGYTVSLTASDGEKTSTATHTLRVTSDHDLQLCPLTARLPDGRHLDLTRSDVHLTLNFTVSGGGTTHFGKSNFGFDSGGTTACFTLAASLWANGDSIDVVVTFDGTPVSADNRWHVTLDDALVSLSHEFKIANKLLPTVRVANGANDLLTPPLPFLGVSGASIPDAVYFDPTEQMHISGHVDWLDGPAAPGIQVEVQIRYIVLRNLDALTPAAAANAVGTAPLVGWCTVGAGVPSLVTDAGGNYFFNTSTDGGDRLGCLQSPLSGVNFFPPGWYEVRVLASCGSGCTGATNGVSPKDYVLEDPLALLVGRVGSPEPPV
ncbi:MAG: PKD domain-containing protein, partial [Thermoplasmatota archaeon]